MLQTTNHPTVGDRVEAVAWTDAAAHLDAYGWATIEQILTAEECRAIAGLFSDDSRFRSHVVMARHGFGRGEYKYFTYPLPEIVADLRSALYAHLAPLANRWNEAMGIAVRYPDAHAAFIERCHQAGGARTRLHGRRVRLDRAAAADAVAGRGGAARPRRWGDLRRPVPSSARRPRGLSREPAAWREPGTVRAPPHGRRDLSRRGVRIRG
jgi:Oxygenase, catalysing oxidative methylation of damaged DNA